MGRTQQGNNNAYCQDNEISWVDWAVRAEDDTELLDYVRALIRLRADHPVFRRRRFFRGQPGRGGRPRLGDIAWFTLAGEEMNDDDWEAGFAKSLTVFLNGRAITEPDRRGGADRRRLLPAAVQRQRGGPDLHHPAAPLRPALGQSTGHGGARDGF